MQDLSRMYCKTEYYNSMFKAKTYRDSAEEFYEKYKEVFNEMNVTAQEASKEINEIYDDEAEETEKKETAEVKKTVFFKKTEEEIPKSKRRKLSKEMQEVINGIADDFITETRRCVSKNGKVPKGRSSIDLNIYVVMYIFPALIETDGQFSYEIAYTIGQKWPEVFNGNKLGCADFNTIDAGFKRKLCYITTAVCESMGKPDDCSELMSLRKFRDDYMMKTAAGREMVEDYYDRAPGIVLSINLTENSDKIYDGIYRNYILPCIGMINEQKYEECMNHYRKMVESLS